MNGETIVRILAGVLVGVAGTVTMDVLGGVSRASILVAAGYGLATCVFPWFLVFPALGFGVCGRKGPPELRLFASSLMNHIFYGLGLWWSAKLVSLA